MASTTRTKYLNEAQHLVLYVFRKSASKAVYPLNDEILLVDDHEVERQGIASLLVRDGKFAAKHEMAPKLSSRFVNSSPSWLFWIFGCRECRAVSLPRRSAARRRTSKSCFCPCTMPRLAELAKTVGAHGFVSKHRPGNRFQSGCCCAIGPANKRHAKTGLARPGGMFRTSQGALCKVGVLRRLCDLGQELLQHDSC